MDDASLEHLLRGYAPPTTSRALDQRVLAQAERIVAGARMRAAVMGAVRECGNVLGFGYVIVVVDLVTGTDADYRVDLI